METIKNVQIKEGTVTLEKEDGTHETFNETTLKLLLNGFSNFVEIALEGS